MPINPPPDQFQENFCLCCSWLCPHQH
jgi:hypothetical protein